jgi:hypothetical protein
MKWSARVQLLWRPTGRWITWGSTTIVSAGDAGIKGSRQYAVSIGPLTACLMLPLSRAIQAEEERRAAPALRRAEKYHSGRRHRRAR